MAGCAVCLHKNVHPNVCSDCLGGTHFKPRIKTNADRVRSLSDEELAELFEIIPHSGNPSTFTIDGFCIDDGLRSKRQWLDWLTRETEE